MHSSVRSPKKQRWVLLYDLAVYEVDDTKRYELITLAAAAISERREALARSRVDNIQEGAALDDASYILSAFREAAEFNQRQKQIGPRTPGISRCFNGRGVMTFQEQVLDDISFGSKIPSASEMSRVHERYFAFCRLWS